MKRLSIVFTCDSEPIGLYEIERRLRTAGFKRPQAGSIMDAELWFSGKPYEQAAALAICRSCPVIGECRRFADEHNRINGYQLQGIWGGRRYGVK